MALEVADDGVDRRCRGTRRRSAPAASRSVVSLTSNGHEPRQRAGVGEGVEQEPGLVRRARARARRACRRRVTAAMSSACALEDRALGAGRVVLGQAGDLVEQLASRGRRRTTWAAAPSGDAVEARRARRRASASREVVAVEVDVDVRRASVMDAPVRRALTDGRAPAAVDDDERAVGDAAPVGVVVERLRRDHDRRPAPDGRGRTASCRTRWRRSRSAVGEQQVAACRSCAPSTVGDRRRPAPRPGDAPASRRSSTRPNSTSVSVVALDRRARARRSAGAAARRRRRRGSRATTPLCENSHGPATNGALPAHLDRRARRREAHARPRARRRRTARASSAKLGVGPASASAVR